MRTLDNSGLGMGRNVRTMRYRCGYRDDHDLTPTIAGMPKNAVLHQQDVRFVPCFSTCSLVFG